MSILSGVLVFFVLLGVVPLAMAAFQTLTATRHHEAYLDYVGRWAPRVAALIPAWNEAPVLTASVERMLALDYPPERLRVYVIDDASTDDTPAVMAALIAKHPGQVIHLRREKGGQGKAHTLNHGLEIVLDDDWAEAVLITDADVLFAPESLRRMTRHLADPSVGAVTAFVKEGSTPGNYVNKSIAYEYATAQAVARRSANVIGAQPCLAGGAQLHSRENLIAIGGRIDTSTLAEDTATTFDTQIAGNRVVFEPHALVFAEEPGSLRALWGQRLRWGRGNFQVTRRYAFVWGRRSRFGPLGSFFLAASWFVVLAQPFLLVLSSLSLITLYALDIPWVWAVFRSLWIISGIVYMLIIGGVYAVDPRTLRRTWVQAVLFSGLVSFILVMVSLFPGPARWLGHEFVQTTGISKSTSDALVQALTVGAYAWLTLSMVLAYLGKVMERIPRIGPFLGVTAIIIAGYGSLLCSVTFAALGAELRGKKAVWVKTEKTGKHMIEDGQ